MPPAGFEPRISPTQGHNSELIPTAYAVVDHHSDDEALARKIQQELDDEAMARRLSEENSAARKARNLEALRVANGDGERAHYANNASTQCPRPPANAANDEEVARKLDQELRDEILAHQLTVQQQQQSQSRAVNAGGASPSKCSFRRVCSCVACTLIIAAVVATVLFLFAGGSGFSLVGVSPGFAQNDPYYNNTRVIPWEIQGKHGLSLEVINSLDSKWNAQFAKAVSQWDNGNPDALTLTTSQIAADSSCSQMPGKLKVCNGNYGDTQWLGINEQLVQSGYMVSSAARMNDFYLDNAIDSQRQYTMCHEIGHGFGLPHTDENFYNADLGNCLDYTIHPWVNEQPGEMNYNRLNETYGTVGSRRDLASSSGRVVQHDHPDWLVPTFSKAVQRLHVAGYDKAEELGWTVLHRSAHGEIHTRHLGAGYMAHVHIMLVMNQLP